MRGGSNVDIITLTLTLSRSHKVCYSLEAYSDMVVDFGWWAKDRLDLWMNHRTGIFFNFLLCLILSRRTDWRSSWRQPGVASKIRLVIDYYHYYLSQIVHFLFRRAWDVLIRTDLTKLVLLPALPVSFALPCDKYDEEAGVTPTDKKIAMSDSTSVGHSVLQKY